MKNYLRLGLLLAPLALAGFTPVAAQDVAEDYYRQWVDVRDGEVSLAFDQTPVNFALYVIQAKTGLQITIPADSETKYLNLKLDRQSIASAARSVISTIGYRNFAMHYDDDGQPNRAVVLGAVPEPVVTAAADQKIAPLTAQEADKLLQDLGRWDDLKDEARLRIEERLRNASPSEERETLVLEYGRQVLGLK